MVLYGFPIKGKLSSVFGIAISLQEVYYVY